MDTMVTVLQAGGVEKFSKKFRDQCGSLGFSPEDITEFEITTQFMPLRAWQSGEMMIDDIEHSSLLSVRLSSGQRYALPYNNNDEFAFFYAEPSIVTDPAYGVQFMDPPKPTKPDPSDPVSERGIVLRLYLELR